MAYGFNDDKSKVEVATAEELETALENVYTKEDIDNKFKILRFEKSFTGYYGGFNADVRLENTNASDVVVLKAAVLFDDNFPHDYLPRAITPWLVGKDRVGAYGEGDYNSVYPKIKLQPSGNDTIITVRVKNFAGIGFSFPVTSSATCEIIVLVLG